MKQNCLTLTIHIWHGSGSEHPGWNGLILPGDFLHHVYSIQPRQVYNSPRKGVGWCSHPCKSCLSWPYDPCRISPVSDQEGHITHVAHIVRISNYGPPCASCTPWVTEKISNVEDGFLACLMKAVPYHMWTGGNLGFTLCYVCMHV